MEQLQALHNAITQTAQAYPMGFFFILGAIVLMAVQSGKMFKIARPFALLVAIVAGVYGVYAIYFSGSAWVCLGGLIMMSFGSWVGQAFTESALESWYPERCLKHYKEVPELPDLATQTPEQLKKLVCELHALATRQQKSLEEWQEKAKAAQDHNNAVNSRITNKDAEPLQA